MQQERAVVPLGEYVKGDITCLKSLYVDCLLFRELIFTHQEGGQFKLDFVAPLYDTSRKCIRKEKGQEKMPFSQCGDYGTRCYSNPNLQGGLLWPSCV